MGLSFFLARRFYGGKRRGRRSQASAPAIRIATLGIALGLAVMIVSVCVVRGFKGEISAKIMGFGSHVEIFNIKSGRQPEAYPIDVRGLTEKVAAVEGVARVQRTSMKPGVLKTDENFQGVSLKGIGADYDPAFIRRHLVAGRLPRFGEEADANKIVISKLQADKLGLQVGDKIYAYFFEQTVKARRFEIAAIYNTNMPQFDRTTVVAPIATVNRLNNWPAYQCSRLEVVLSDPSQLDAITPRIAAAVNGALNGAGGGPAVLSIRDLYPQIFSWLDLLDFNVLIILVIMVCVAGFTMVSGLFILILERVGTIGILKAMGAGNTRIRHVFLWLATFVVGRGMLLGNVIGLGIVWLQDRFHLVGLDAAAYYVDAVPVDINVLVLVLLNVSTLAVTVLALVGPSYMVSLIQPAKAIRFD